MRGFSLSTSEGAFFFTKLTQAVKSDSACSYRAKSVELEEAVEFAKVSSVTSKLLSVSSMDSMGASMVKDRLTMNSVSLVSVIVIKAK